MLRRKLYEPRDIYERAATQGARSRNPVIVIPGVLGSQLADPVTGRVFWGGRRDDYCRQTDSGEACLIGHPMDESKSLAELDPRARVDGVARKLQVRTPAFSICVSAYETILDMLGVGGYVKGVEKPKRKTLDYRAESLATCFEFAYDWRLSVDQNAVKLSSFVDRVIDFVSKERGSSEDVKVDIVAHSMGGLVTRYFLRYGDRLLDEDGSAPETTWAGAKLVDHAIFIGTPNGGALGSVKVLTEGLRKHAAFPDYDAAMLGTLPGIYQLMPRTRHGPVVVDGSPIEELYDADAWAEHGWGLASREGEERLKVLLPGVDSSEARRRIALDHLRKCLRRAEAVHASIDVAAPFPRSTRAYLFAGDRHPTPRVAEVARGSGKFRVVSHAPGDGTVLRSSALLDERTEGDDDPRVRSELDWDGVVFLQAGHMGLTKDRTFINSALWYLLEKPRRERVVVH